MLMYSSECVCWFAFSHGLPDLSSIWKIYVAGIIDVKTVFHSSGLNLDMCPIILSICKRFAFFIPAAIAVFYFVTCWTMIGDLTFCCAVVIYGQFVGITPIRVPLAYFMPFPFADAKSRRGRKVLGVCATT